MAGTIGQIRREWFLKGRADNRVFGVREIAKISAWAAGDELRVGSNEVEERSL